jgi:hypothetical protein
MVSAARSFPAFLLFAGLLMAAPACASQGYYAYARDYDRDIDRRAYDNGYAEGLSHGERDARGGRTFSVERHDDYRDADDGYRRGEGDRERYRHAFRQGFQAGYSTGFTRIARDRGYGYGYEPPRATAPYRYPAPYPPAGPPAAYVSPAAQVGYRDGYEVGRNDARDRESYDPVRSNRYRSGDHEYSSRYGPKELYKREYRSAFQQGYEQAYREYRRY